MTLRSHHIAVRLCKILHDDCENGNITIARAVHEGDMPVHDELKAKFHRLMSQGQFGY